MIKTRYQYDERNKNEIKIFIDSSGEESDISSFYDADIAHEKEENVVIEPFDDSNGAVAFQLTPENLESLEYQNILEHMGPLGYKYWVLNLEAEESHKKGSIAEAIDKITKAASLVTQNQNMIANSDHKAVVIYNYLRFTHDDSHAGIALKKVLVKYMPKVLLIAERVHNEFVATKVLEIMERGLDCEHNVKATAASDLALQIPAQSYKDDDVGVIGEGGDSTRVLKEPITSDEDSTLTIHDRDSGSSGHSMNDLGKQFALHMLSETCASGYDSRELSGVTSAIINDEA